MKERNPYYEKPVVYQLPGMSTVRAQSHLVCKLPYNLELTLDQYLPANVSRPTQLPGVLFIHGGPLHSGSPLPKDWAAFVSYGQLVAASGLIGLMFNHRYYGPQRITQSSEDIESVFEYIHANAQELGLDANRICAWVFSGGGKLLPIILRKGEGMLKSLVLYYTLLDHQGNGDLWQKAFTRLPIGVAKAGLDRANINRSLDQLVEQAQAAKATLEFWHHAEGHHGFDIRDDNTRSKEILASTLEFIQAHT